MSSGMQGCCCLALCDCNGTVTALSSARLHGVVQAAIIQPPWHQPTKTNGKMPIRDQVIDSSLRLSS